MEARREASAEDEAEGAAFEAGPSHPPSTPPRSTASTIVTDGSLGDVAKWKDADGSSHRVSTARRTSRMIGSKVGISPPPPPGPPPSNPPPLPPPSFHPFASVTSTSRRLSQRPIPSARSSTINALHKSPMSNRPSLPAGPPPSESLPPLPGQPRNASGSLNANERAESPTPGYPAESLGSPLRAAHPQQPTQIGESSSTTTVRTSRTAKPRTPSRHLLQNALDLAQKAVEMDRDNDVIGALAAYREAVSKLRSVMERVGLEAGGVGNEKKMGKSEEEGRTLKGIHDAYVARIQLLSSYEVSEAGSEPTAAGPSPIEIKGQSFAQISSRQSLDEGATTGIGNLMLSDAPRLSANSPPRLSPSRSTPAKMTTSHGGDLDQSPRLPSINGSASDEMSLQQALDQVADASASATGSTVPFPSSSRNPNLPHSAGHRSIGLGHPSTSPSNLVSSSPHAHVRNASMVSIETTSSSMSPASRRFKRRNKPSLGLDMEADLTGIDGVVGDMELLTTTPTESHLMLSPNSQNQAQVGKTAHSEERPLPPVPQSQSGEHNTQQTRRIRAGSNASVSSAGSAMRSPTGGYLVSPSTNKGMISQRRRSRHGSVGINEMLMEQQEGEHNAQRSRTTSQSGTRSGDTDLPPVPSASKHQPSFSISSQFSVNSGGGSPLLIQQPNPLLQQLSSLERGKSLRINTSSSNGLTPPTTTTTTRQSSYSSHNPSFGSRLPSDANNSPRSYSSFSPLSSLPGPQPTEESLRPFHVLKILRQSMDVDGPGAHLTPAIHITPAIWNPATWTKLSAAAAQADKTNVPKIVAQDVKTRCMHTLALCLESVKGAGYELLAGPREWRRGSQGAGAEEQKWKGLAEEFVRALDDLEEEMDTASKLLSKGGVGVSIWKGNKAVSSSKSWGSRISRGMDKISNNKSLDTPDRYVDNLAYFCVTSQILADHLANFIGPCTPAYASISEKAYRDIEVRVKRSAEFVRVVVVPFVLEDFKQFLLRYLKGGVRYLED
ncbi:hypothetical protein J010_03870 [Cryptococcus neoformans]|nr:hypothetical protein C353_03963 [Cryptococcus neoformans var. grubii AD1-83a]OXG49080.1 hypothetical protein C355_03766 [Cryptococcus neoformans var. grubii Th84]OXG57248.1 hypothetical protein C354_03895 [Cryptococcus neoformans var. grubii MW-RSA1955]OXG62379.1 hypothetical protein C351_03837 [Cryptococcus neoformans var. grubii c8]OXG78958.1 hypothetical protein C350_03842 [Cryptococcus neoformans var. grubii MW-RSA36]OXG85445.1 hypothetical protein C346_03906 [Cryptococcus neoformans va